MFKKRFSMTDYIKKGHSVIELDNEFASKILDNLKNEHMVLFTTEDDIFDVKSKVYRERYIAKKTLFDPLNVREDYKTLMNGIADEIDVVLKNYKYGKEESCRFAMALLGMPGYMMEPHSDEGDRAASIALAYFSDTQFNEETGGEIVFYKVIFDDNGSVVERKEINRVFPNTGTVVIVNPASPLFQHEVLPVLDPVAKRYSLFMNYGTKDVPDWSMDFNEIKGFVDKETIYGTLKPDEEVLNV